MEGKIQKKFRNKSDFVYFLRIVTMSGTLTTVLSSALASMKLILNTSVIFTK